MREDVLALYCARLDEMMQHFLRRFHLEIADALNKGITGNQFIVMKIISDRGRATVSEVAQDLSVSLSAITAQVDRLCRAGMVVRSRSEEDRRVVWLELTEQGQNMVDIYQASRMRLIQRYLGHLDEKDLLHMIGVYEKIIAVMREEKEVDSEKTGVDKQGR